MTFAGTGHGAVMTWDVNWQTDDTPYLVRDFQLHREEGASADIASLAFKRGPNWNTVFIEGMRRRRVMPDFYTTTPFSCSVLLETNRQNSNTLTYNVPPVIQLDTFTNPMLQLRTTGRVAIIFPPRQPNTVTPATLAGLGYVVSHDYGQLSSNQTHMATLTLEWSYAPQWAGETVA